MTHKKSSKLGLGVLLGAAAGAVAGLFLAPKAGKELRKDAKKLSQTAMKFSDEYRKKLDKKEPEEVAKIVFGDVSEASTKLAKRAHKDLSVELAQLKEKYNKIDKKKYGEAVKTVVEGFKADKSIPDGTLKKLATYLEKDAQKLVASTKKKTAAKKKAPAKRKVATKASAKK